MSTVFAPTRLVAALLPVVACLAACGESDHAPATSPVPVAVSQARGVPDFTRLVDRAGPAVVHVTASQPPAPRSGEDATSPGSSEFQHPFGPGPSPDRFGLRGVGSGFIISEDGYVLTNAHVLDGAEVVTVRLADAKREFRAKVVGSDAHTDIALLKVDATGLPVVPLGSSQRLKVGEWVVAIGSPFGFVNTLTAGVVSAKGRLLPDGSLTPFLQTDVAVNPGNSGGPLLNLAGEVVGINSQIYTRTGGYMGVSFATPIEVALRVSAQLRERGYVARGRIGVSASPLTDEVARAVGLKEARGALIAAVEDGGPAQAAGLAVGDVVLSFDGSQVADATDLARLVADTRPGTRSKAEVWRGGDQIIAQVTVVELKSGS